MIFPLDKPPPERLKSCPKAELKSEGFAPAAVKMNVFKLAFTLGFQTRISKLSEFGLSTYKFNDIFLKDGKA
jgi:hypothetical protein